MSASPAEVRAWARAEGYTVNTRGAIPVTLQDAYDAAHPDLNGGPPGPVDDDFGDFPDIAEPDAPPADPETAPRRPRTNKAVGKTPAGRWPFGGRSKPKGKAKPRVPVEDIIAAAWRAAAKLATPLPPLHRTLRMQAPVAGALLEDSVRGTVVDTVLQPIARMAGQGKAFAALIGPPALVTAGTLHLAKAQAEGVAPNPLIMGVITESLRSTLMLWMEVSGPKFAEAVAREQEFEEKYGADVDKMIAWLLSPPPDPGDAAAVEAEEAAIRRAQGIL